MAEQPLFWVGNQNPSITETIRNDDGTPHDLTGQTVRFRMRAVGAAAGVYKVDQPAVIANPAAGTVRYDWQAADVDTAGQYLVWWQVTTTVGGKTQDVAEAVIEFREHANAANYVELEQLKASAEMTGTSFADQDLMMAIGAASRTVDNATGRRFWLDAGTANIRYYTPELERSLLIDDLVTLTSVRVSRSTDGTFSETWTAGAEFLLEPMNAPSGYPPRPYEQITLRSYGAASGFRPWFRTDLYRSVEVTGQFGWPEVPDDIRVATMILAAKFTKRIREAPFGIAGFGSDGLAVRIARTDPDVAPIIASYSRKRLLV